MITQLELFPEGTDFSLYPRSKHLYDGLRKHFGMDYSDRLFGCFRFVDGLTTLALSRPVIDVVRFDKWLKETHCNDYPDNISMTEAIRKFYGAEANEWLLRNIH